MIFTTTVALLVAQYMVSLITASANVAVVVLGQSEVFLEVRLASLAVAGESSRFKHRFERANHGVFLKLEAGSAHLENGHYASSFEHAVFKVAILLPVQVFVALGSQLVPHVLAELIKVDLKITWGNFNHVVDEEGDEFTFSGRNLGCRLYHIFTNFPK